MFLQKERERDTVVRSVVVGFRANFSNYARQQWLARYSVSGYHLGPDEFHANCALRRFRAKKYNRSFTSRSGIDLQWHGAASSFGIDSDFRKFRAEIPVSSENAALHHNVGISYGSDLRFLRLVPTVSVSPERELTLSIFSASKLTPPSPLLYVPARGCSRVCFYASAVFFSA